MTIRPLLAQGRPRMPKRTIASEGDAQDALDANAAAAASAAEDREFALRAASGDHDAFEALVRKYRRRSIAIAQRIVLDAEAARDVAQDAFLRLYKSLHRYDPAQRFYTWFYRVVVHLAIDHLRRARHTPRRLGEFGEDGEAGGHFRRAGRAPGDDPDEPRVRAERAEVEARVRSVLATLPGKYRLLLVLRDMEGFTSKEISEIARWNHATVRWRLHRARRLFRDAWRAAGFPEAGAADGG